MVPVNSPTPESWLLKARDFYTKENWIGALSCVRNALRLDVKNLDAWHLGCEILLKQDRQYDALRYAKALKRFAKIVHRSDQIAFADQINSQVDEYYATQHLRLGETDLSHFASKGDLSKVKELLERGHDPNERNRYHWTALHRVAMHGSGEMATLLIQHGADLEAENEQKETPLITACSFDNKAIIPVLLSAGARVNHVAKEKHTALWYAISSMKDLDTVRLLIEAGADANETYAYADNPFLLSVSAQKADVTNYLLTLTEDPARMNQHQVCALHFAATYNDTDLIQKLLHRGVDVNQKTNYGSTALMDAAEKNNLEAARLLLSQKADVTAVSQYGETAMSLAEHQGHEEMVELLKQYS